MWNSRRSILLSLVLVYMFGLAFIAAAFALPSLVDWYILAAGRSPEIRGTLVRGMYLCLPFALAALVSLHILLRNLLAEKLFVQQNVTLLRVLSWCCFGAALVSLITGRVYMPFYLLTAAAGFMGLILRVVKNVFCSAIEIKAENDMTI